MFIFLDESGQFGKNENDKYFVVASFTTKNHYKTDKSFKSWTHSKFPKKMRNQNEIKWSTSGVDNKLRVNTVKHISNLDISIHYGFLLKSNIPKLYKTKKGLDSGLLYIKIISKILESYLPTKEKEIYIFCDNRSLRNITKSQFENMIKGHLVPLCSRDTLIFVKMIDSTFNTNMQIVDWISGAIAKYLEKSTNGSKYFDILKDKISPNVIEFFKD